MPMISKVFIDTNVFVATHDNKDSTHLKAKYLFEKLALSNTEFYTSSDIIGESLTVISQKIGKNEAIKFLKKVKIIAKEIFIDEVLHYAARNFYRRVKSKNVSFIDCSSVVAMKKHKIKFIFSFDESFKTLGVTLASDAFNN